MLKAPGSDDSPGWKKTRRRKAPDGLVQRRIQFFISNSRSSSDGVLFPCGGPRVENDVLNSSRGITGGVGDQIEGPSRLRKGRLKKVKGF